MTTNMGKTRALTLTLLKLFFAITFMHTSALDVSLSLPQTTIKAQIGEELRITCLASKCSNKNPSFTWSTLMDKILGGNVISVGQTSTLTMKVDAESEGSYRCTVSCDNAPGEKSFKILVYSFPSDPTLHISSLVVGQQSRITCIIPSIYPYEMLGADIKLNEEIVVEFASEEITLNNYEIQNISLTHDLILTDDVKKIKCEAILPFQDDNIEPIKRQTEQDVTLMYPPAEPQITVEPSTMVKAGEEIQLLCSSDSGSQAVVQWLKKEGDEELEMPSNDQGTLTISHAEPQNSGVYICYVENGAGKTSSQVEINVQGLAEKPMLSLKPGTRVVAGQAVTIECLVSASTNVILQKMSEDGDVFLASTGKIIINEADPIDTAEYKCIAENQYGVSETSESLTVEYPPRETRLSSSSIELNEGDTVTLTCVSKGVPAPTISIYKLLTSGESVLLSEDPEITLSNVTSGIYQCQASNRLGSEKDKLELIVRVPPINTFMTIMPSHAVKEGDSVHIQCISESSPAPKLVLKMKTELGIHELESEHGQYSISHAAVEHTGTYICESSNIIGQQIAEAILTVQAPPQNTHLSITPSSVVREGDNVQIRCTSEASPAPRLALKMKTEDDVVDLVSDGGEYHILHAEVRHTGRYICESTNAIGNEIVETTLHVEAPPQNTHLSITPSSVVREGDNVQIRCTSEASPAPRLALKMKTEDDVVDLVSDGGEYHILHAEVRHTGRYICESTNAIGNEIVETTLHVEVPPRNTYIVINPSAVVKVGDSVQIWCSSEGSPDPSLVLKLRIEDELISLESSDGFYNITHVGMENAGTYICESTNEVGQQVVVDTLTVQIPPRNTTVVVTPSQNIKEGDTVTITCETHSIPSPTMILQKVCDKNNTVLQSSNGTFTLHNVTRNDTGTYTLTIINKVGNETEVISIFVAEPQQQSPIFNPTSMFIFGSAAFVTAGIIGSIIYHLKKSKLKGSYSLVKALRSKV